MCPVRTTIILSTSLTATFHISHPRPSPTDFSHNFLKSQALKALHTLLPYQLVGLHNSPATLFRFLIQCHYFPKDFPDSLIFNSFISLFTIFSLYLPKFIIFNYLCVILLPKLDYQLHNSRNFCFLDTVFPAPQTLSGIQ